MCEDQHSEPTALAPGGATWARRAGINDDIEHLLAVAVGPGEVEMVGSVATGTPLVSNSRIGADLISLEAGQRFAPHTHPGDHVLVVVAGCGTLTLDGAIYPTEAGQVLIVDGEMPHAVGAVTDHLILAIGSPHRPVDASDRMVLVEYLAVLSAEREMRCLICHLTTAGDEASRLHDLGCEHCPCHDCC